VEDELARRGVPARSRARLLAELRDHLDDLTEGGSQMITEEIESRIGPPDELAAVATEEYRKASWVHRHPFVVFGLAPVPVTFACLLTFLVAVALVGTLIFWAAGWLDDPPRPVAVVGAMTLHYGVRFVPFLLAVALMGWLAVKYRVGWKWLAGAAAQVALVGGLFASNLSLSEVPGQSTWSLGLTLPGWDLAGSSPWSPFFLQPEWGQLVQVAVPLVVGLLFILVLRRRAGVMVV
jgi:hypothetical protein